MILTVTRAFVVLRPIRKSPYSSLVTVGRFASPKKVFIIARLELRSNLATKLYRKGQILVLSFQKSK